MNIHFTDRNLFDDLIMNSVVEATVGSHMYSLDNTNSDIDKLYIYVEDTANRNSFMWEHHQLQYKSVGVNNIAIDYNFTSLQGFIRNTLSGDATINYEVLFSDELRDSELNWLWTMRHDFRNYNVIKSYLGLAKRDLKYWRKDSYNGTKNTSDTDKKLAHFVRGVIFAKNILETNFSLDLKATTTFMDCGYDDFELVDRLKNGTLDYSYDLLTKNFELLMNETRDKLNYLHNSRDISIYMEVDKLAKLDELTKEFIKTYCFNNTIEFLEYGNLFYSAMENGLKYD
jgi:predicted nucleotidyltransferase